VNLWAKLVPNRASTKDKQSVKSIKGNKYIEKMHLFLLESSSEATQKAGALEPTIGPVPTRKTPIKNATANASAPAVAKLFKTFYC